MSAPRVRRVGDAALSVDFGEALDARLAARVRALDASLRAAPLAGVGERVPTCRALLVLYDPGVTDFEGLAADLCQRAERAAPAPAPSRRHVIPVRYGGDDGPDLADVARACGRSEAEVVALHAGSDYDAWMLGFLPGFAYLGLLPAELQLPRRASPRARVPAGSVAIAGRQTGVYPFASPGGWHLIGRTSSRLFDPRREPPVLVQPGDRVRFTAVSRLDEQPRVDAPSAVAASPSLEVLEGGWRTSVQDQGRPGWRRYGVTAAGALDRAALARANAAVGNPPDAAALEVTLTGPRVAFLAPCVFALAGADLGAVLERADLCLPWPVPRGVAVRARPGNVLSFGARRAGCRAYLAFAGGIDVPVVLGSRSTDLTAGFGGFSGRALRTGDRLALLAPGRGATPPPAREEDAALDLTVRVHLGPQDDHFGPAALWRFWETAWHVSTTSDRVGCRLSGAALAHAGPAEIVSDGMVPGCIQVPPDGQPIVSLADGPTTGGYPKIATVVGADLPRLAQLVPGASRLRFEPA